MPKMSAYCKAYPISRLREYPHWTEPVGTSADSYLFVHDNYVVTDGVFRDENLVFADVSEEWKRYCRETLGFQPSAPAA